MKIFASAGYLAFLGLHCLHNKESKILQVAGDLKIVTGSRIRSIICKGPKYRFPLPIDFKSCHEEIACAFQEFCNRWYHVESNVLNIWKLNIFKIIDGRISFYCNNNYLDLLPSTHRISFRHLKKGIHEFHRRFVLVPADKAANNVVVV